MRLNKLISQAGLGSRKQADIWIAEGRVTVNEQKADIGQKVTQADQVFFDGQPVDWHSSVFLVAYHKPVGVVCTHDQSVANNLVESTGLTQHFSAMGRLDKASEGLMILTNQGELTNHILQPAFAHEKEYWVEVDQALTQHFVTTMQQGVEIMGQMTKPCEVEATGECCFKIVLTQGLNKQIRRMCKALGFRVLRLQRIRIAQVSLGDLAVNTLRELDDDEKLALQQLLPS
ncbi:pseudouridine synthase [Hydrogenovibrio sp. 3SP14C1]|uniref:pseudouridine synthase n=1 Tax=Hydrogenovibrio sp. 3SP14C1 TaxID=3038774 RepID=UPI002416D9FA|nr:pseudouridine synthase [Hydrogenovibrio sp. 3SP14C1]MDG4812400.1 pseudouridine synthase [Hydrogenovibrio sp. 3SP14C1]